MIQEFAPTQAPASFTRGTQRLKLYFPQVLSWFGSVDSLLAWRFLERWPDLASLRTARRSTLRAFLEHDRRIG